MDSKILRIKCPDCGAVLNVKYLAGIENKVVKCPVCKQSAPFYQFKKLDAVVEDSETQYPEGKSGESTQFSDKNNVADSPNFSIGTLKLVGSTLAPFRLKPGRNVVGRKSDASSADILIDTAGSRRMSREHLLIEVKKVQGKGFVHYVSLFKEKVNNSYLNQTLIEYGDCMVLKSGDMLKLPDADLMFEIPDGDATEL